MRYLPYAASAMATTFAVFGSFGIAGAQEEAPGGLEVVTVTAQRRAERLQDVPISVSAFSPAEMERRNIVEAQDLIQYIPNLQGNNVTGIGTANVYYLRGIGNNESIATFDPPVGTYVDDIYIARVNMNNFGFFDLESVEVLRGPQGTLFGRNTSGGAINVKLRRPAETFGGSGEIGYGEFNRELVRGTVDVPMSEKVLTQLGAYHLRQDGYVRSVTTGQRLNGVSSRGARAAMTFNATDNLKWDVAANYFYSNELNLMNFECEMFDSGVATPGAPPNCRDRFAISGFARAGGTAGLRNVLIGLPSTGAPGTIVANATFVPYALSGGLADQELGNKTRQTIISSNFELELDNLTLNFITGYVDLDEKYNLEYQDGRVGRSLGVPNPPIPYIVDANGVVSPNGAFILDNYAQAEEFTQEIKATGSLGGGFIRYVAGVYYFHDENDTQFADIVTSFLPAVPPQTAATPRPYRTFVSGDRLLENSTTSSAAYAQGDFHFTDRFFATAGVRYTDERKKVAIADFRDPRVAPVIGGFLRPDLRLDTANLRAYGFPTELVTRLWTPHFAVNHRLLDDALVFATATRGFRSGGWNVRGVDISSFAPFFAEKVWTYELGTKSEWFDRRLRANITLFDTEVSDFQLATAFVQANGTPTFITQNAADFRDVGVEAEINALPIERLNLFASIGYQDAEYRNIPSSILAQRDGCRAARAAGQTGAGTVCAVGIVTYDGEIGTPPRTPEWTMAAGVSYEIPTGFGVRITPSVNVTYQSSSYSSANNLSYYINPAGVVNVTGDGEFVSGAYTKAFTVVNASLTLQTDDGRWRATLDCSNCFDEVWSQSTISGYSYISPPGAWSIRLGYSF